MMRRRSRAFSPRCGASPSSASSRRAPWDPRTPCRRSCSDRDSISSRCRFTTPNVSEILGVPVHRSLATVLPPADVVQIFRRPADVPQHLDDILAAKPRVVWMQLGIRNDAVAEALARAGIHVIQNRCLQVELRRSSRSCNRLKTGSGRTARVATSAPGSARPPSLDTAPCRRARTGLPPTRSAPRETPPRRRWP